MRALLTIDYLYSILHYDSQTGIFTWRVTKSAKAPAGKRAGSIERKKGAINHRRHIAIDGVFYYEHRLAWLYFWGCWPTFDVDHRNGKSEENFIDNLREATKSQNGANVPKPRTADDLPLGVYFVKAKGRFGAQIKKLGEREWLGLHDTADDAAAAYAEAAHRIHGEFSSITSRGVHSGL